MTVPSFRLKAPLTLDPNRTPLILPPTSGNFDSFCSNESDGSSLLSCSTACPNANTSYWANASYGAFEGAEKATTQAPDLTRRSIKMTGKWQACNERRRGKHNHSMSCHVMSLWSRLERQYLNQQSGKCVYIV